MHIVLIWYSVPQGVYPFLMTHSDYRLDHCLKLCREHKIPDAEETTHVLANALCKALGITLAVSSFIIPQYLCSLRMSATAITH